MKPEHRQLLLQDLCARLPYGVKASNGYGILELTPRTDVIYIVDNGNIPFLRPLSSMTEEEKEDMHNILSPEGTAIYENEGIATPCNHHGEWISYEFMARIVDWLNAHHFDYNGLIGKGLALEATEDMYN